VYKNLLEGTIGGTADKTLLQKIIACARAPCHESDSAQEQFRTTRRVSFDHSLFEVSGYYLSFDTTTEQEIIKHKKHNSK
jgi:hypothetical protein